MQEGLNGKKIMLKLPNLKKQFLKKEEAITPETASSQTLN